MPEKQYPKYPILANFLFVPAVQPIQGPNAKIELVFCSVSVVRELDDPREHAKHMLGKGCMSTSRDVCMGFVAKFRADFNCP